MRETPRRRKAHRLCQPREAKINRGSEASGGQRILGKEGLSGFRSSETLTTTPSITCCCFTLMAGGKLLAVSYYMAGTNFRASANQLAEGIELRPDGTPVNLTALPYYFLVSHAAELFLKAALLKRGFPAEDLKKFDYRHDLNALLSELQKKGLSVTSHTVAVVNGLAEQHKKHTLRYINLFDKNKLYWPPISVISEALDELFSLTRISTQGK